MDRFLGEIKKGSEAPPDLNEICNFDDSGIKFTLKVEKNSKIKNCGILDSIMIKIKRNFSF